MTTHGSQLTPSVGDGDHAQGPAMAPVTLVEYGDYECPYCGAAYPTVKEIQRRLGDRLRFVFRNFPITTAHPRDRIGHGAILPGHGGARLHGPRSRRLHERRSERRQWDPDVLHQRPAS
jgi:hypothetical protein